MSPLFIGLNGLDLLAVVLATAWFVLLAREALNR
jgi:hypothetical protein